MLSLCLVIGLMFAGLTLGPVKATTPAPFTMCEYKGAYYSLGQQWQDGPCDQCYCMSIAANVSICQKSCPTFTFMPSQCKAVTPAGKCCPEVSCESSKKCVYKGKFYNENQTWNDGCDAVCTCVSASTRLVQCRTRCPQFTGIPAGCNLVPPVAGECCSSIHCDGNPVG
ncbi:putative epidermal cell surface receptor [Liolophura sinensis]|uniref:putative epidermal cell surface receptor n=1 Tax=Liolophura sinensis TaxID=3198878 RepID=UPI0031592A15